MADIDHNLTGLKKEIAEALQQMKDLKLDRADANASMGEIRSRLEAKGIPKKAFAMAQTYLNMDPEDREGFDIAYAICREAGGLPLQEDLFQAADRKAAEADADSPAKEPDAGEIAKVFASEDSAKTKGKKVLPSSAGSGTIN